MGFQYKRDKVSDSIGKIVMLLFLVIITGYIFPLRFALYTLLLTIIIVYAINYKRKKLLKTIYIKAFSTYVFVYILWMITFSISPWLKMQEFRWTHPHWQVVKPQINDTQVHHFPGYKSNGFAYLSVDYQYKQQEEIVEATEKYAIRAYFPFWSKLSSGEKKEKLQQIISPQLAGNASLLFINKKDPQEIKLFLSKQPIYLRGSIIFQFLSGFFVICLLFCGSLLVVVGYLIRLRISRRNQQSSLYHKLLRKAEEGIQ